MDRIYILQKEYTKDRYNPDGMILEHLIRQYAKRNCDEVFVMEELQCSVFFRDTNKLRRKVIPVGYLEFVQKSMDGIHEKHIQMQPIEVPKELRNFCHRKYDICFGKDIPKEIKADCSKWFIKDADRLKFFTNTLCIGTCEDYMEPDRKYVVSEMVNIISEYRVFVWKDNIISIQNYQGDPGILPEGKIIKEIIEKYKVLEHPKAYILDIGVIRKEKEYTGIIEIQPFVSCGLYGFYDEKILDMLEAGIDWYISH